MLRWPKKMPRVPPDPAMATDSKVGGDSKDKKKKAKLPEPVQQQKLLQATPKIGPPKAKQEATGPGAQPTTAAKAKPPPLPKPPAAKQMPTAPKGPGTKATPPPAPKGTLQAKAAPVTTPAAERPAVARANTATCHCQGQANTATCHCRGQLHDREMGLDKTRLGGLEIFIVVER